MVIPIRDKTLPTVIGCVDQALRAFGGVPTYGLTDNEKTLTVDHVARIPVRNPRDRDRGPPLRADPAFLSAGGPGVQGRLGGDGPCRQGGLVPTDANLLDDYPDWAALEAACAAFCDTVNGRVHRVTRRAPAEMLAEEAARLHALPEHPYTTVFGQARTVGVDQPTIQWEWWRVLRPPRPSRNPVWVRRHGDDIIVTHLGAGGPVEVARHEVTTPGNPRIDPAHYPPGPRDTRSDRTPVAGTDAGT